MITARAAGRYIDKTPNQRKLMYDDGGIAEIVEVIMYADSRSASFTRRLAPQLKGATDRETLYNIWKFTRSNVRYVRDQVGKEVIKSPGKFWADRKGDCKSFTIFEGSILKNLGYRYKYRVALYDPKNPESGHIYPVVMLKGKEVILDAVHTRFDDEVPYWKAYDYSPGRSSISGTEVPKPSKTGQLAWAVAGVALVIGAIKLFA